MNFNKNIENYMRNSLKKEIRRKLIHMIGLVFPIVYLYIPMIYAQIITCAVALISIYMDLNRHSNHTIHKIIDFCFRKVMRPHEERGISGSTYMAMGLAVSVLLFPKNVVITSWYILFFADSLAAIAGMVTPHKDYIVGNKTFQGSCVFFFATFAICVMCRELLFLPMSFIHIVLTAFSVTIVELYSSSFGLDDNLTIPVSACIFLNM